MKSNSTETTIQLFRRDKETTQRHALDYVDRLQSRIYCNLQIGKVGISGEGQLWNSYYGSLLIMKIISSEYIILMICEKSLRNNLIHEILA